MTLRRSSPTLWLLLFAVLLLGAIGVSRADPTFETVDYPFVLASPLARVTDYPFSSSTTAPSPTPSPSPTPTGTAAGFLLQDNGGKILQSNGGGILIQR